MLRCVAFFVVTFAVLTTALPPLSISEALNASSNPSELDGPINSTALDGVNSTRQGWTSPPNQRGTIDILWSSLLTMFLCSWSMLCLNIPSREDSKWKIMHRRFWLTCLCFLGPEFTLQSAIGQFASARASKKEFQKAGITPWSLRHGFYADMGGFVLHTNDDFEAFPVDAKQLCFLITHEFVENPKITDEAIKDKDKVDSLLRLLTLAQVGWFMANVIGRACQNLPITAIELTTIAFIWCSTWTMAFWWRKPADVQIPHPLYTESTIEEIRAAVNQWALDHKMQPCEDLRSIRARTPLDRLSRKEWHWSRYWSNWINILRHVGIWFAPKKTPVDRFENTISLPVPPRLYAAYMAITFPYCAFFAAGWNINFPTYIELFLWRTAAIGILSVAVLFPLVTTLAFTLYPKLKGSTSDGDRSRHEKLMLRDTPTSGPSKIRRILHSAAESVRNNSIGHDPDLTIPLKAILPVYVLAVVYCFCRTYVVLEDIVELRSLPPESFVTVDWSELLPHIG